MSGASTTGAANHQFGVYVHIPFCARRCDFCAFATWTDRHHLHQAYVDACCREVDEAGLPPATSVFFGGGTPSLLDPALLVGILDRIDLAPDAEVTVECNPDTVNEELLSTYRAHGVNRLSFGVQSMVPSVLASLGRTHDPDNVRRCADLARSLGFATWNLDLIYGAAGESLDDWQRTLDAVLDLEPPHVSAYALTIEAGTPLAADSLRHPDDDDQADKYIAAETAFASAGLAWYEISNWARPGNACRHNQLYWNQGAYRGIGCAAHSHLDGRRWWNLRTPDRYIGAVGAGASVVASEEYLDLEDRRIEALQLSLRTAAGVPSEALSDGDRGRLDGLVVEGNGRTTLTPRGRLLANEVAVSLR